MTKKHLDDRFEKYEDFEERNEAELNEWWDRYEAIEEPDDDWLDDNASLGLID